MPSSFVANLAGQEPWELRGANDARLRALEARLVTAEAELAVVNLVAWTTWAPVITQGNTPSKTTVRATYQRIGRAIIANFDVSFTTAGTVNTNILTTLPVPAAHASAIGGSFRYFDTGTTNHAGTVLGSSTTATGFVYDGWGNQMGNGDLIIASGDSLQVTMIYEAAS